ncbi:acyltransferase family protein [Parabacteroides distasonis]|uniref:acyltransferase family protein n=1 Tax=Parabacteroides distasonis TaxID=823 RepID=UPI001F2CBDC1|nr:acyltransferase [Parabacteroides distasonis]MCE9042433.1 acyltransferase [Parabacteroides distasonis]
MNIQNIYLSSKPHYEILDGLRGVAAAMVVAFHLLEAHSGGNHLNQIINHGYLAVDFFFMLSGFVIGYAYDDRWNRMSMGTFFKRRLIRLQPMVVMGSFVGAALFWFQKAPCYPAMEGVSVGALLLVMLLGCTLLPLPLKWDIRGWMEMHPLNGPAWSLYYEYIGNILYALFIRKFSKTALTVFVAIAACFTVHRCLTAPVGDIVGGWALNWEQQYVGLVRLMYPFFGGLLLSRLGWLIRTRKHAFWWCSLMIIVVLSVPRIGGEDGYWMNGLYEAFCIICIFPVIVSMGAGGRITGRRSAAVCKFLGDISYPVYITHYPLVYIYTAWACNHQATLTEGLPYILLTFVGAFTLAYVSLKFYDLPVRKWLTKHFLKKR